MPGGNSVFTYRKLDDIRQFQQSQDVTDRGTIHAQLSGKFLDGAAEAIEVIAERLGLLQYIQVLPLYILFDGGFADLPVFQFDDSAGNRLQSCLLGGSPPSFAGDDLIPVTTLADQQRLQNAVLANAVRKFVDLLFVETASGLKRIAFEQLKTDFIGSQ